MADALPAAGEVWIALIRGIGPPTHKAMPLRALRDRCEEAELRDVRNVLATGNLVFRSTQREREIQAILDDAVRSFDLTQEVILRRRKALSDVIRRNPFQDAAAERPDRLLVLFLAKPPTTEAAAMLAEKAERERVSAAGREIYIDFGPRGTAEELLTGVLDRALGRKCTGRNWRTISRIYKIAEDSKGGA